MTEHTIYVPDNSVYNDNNNCNTGMMWDNTTQQCITDSSISPSTPWWAWVLIIITLGAIIGFVIWFIIWSTSTDNSGSSISELDISGTEYKVLSTTSIGVTWTAVSNPNDEVTLYVNPTGESMNFTTSGSPLGKYHSSGKVPGVNPSGGTASASVSGLKDNTSYDAIVVVTNTDFPNDSHKGKVESGIHTSSSIPLGPKFIINASGQNGQINYTLSPPEGIPAFVSYTRAVIDPNNSLFHYDSDGFICATTQGQQITGDTMCTDGSSILYSGALSLGTTSTTGFVGDSQLRIATKSSLSTTELEDAKWQYNLTGNNQWCLINGTGCMNYDADSPDIVFVATVDPTPVPNVFAVTTDAATIPGSQAVFVSSSGSKWTNITFTA